MKTFIGIAVIASALVSWQPNANATTMIASEVKGQPLTRAACDMAGLAWDDNGNVCDWKPQEQFASGPTTEAIALSQPLTRAACDMARFAWKDEANVCDWPVERAISTAAPEITGAITSSQPLTRATCDRAGLAWDDNRNICDWKSTKWTTPSPSLEITSKPQRSTQVNGHTKRKYTHRSPRKTQVVERRPFRLFQLFRN